MGRLRHSRTEELVEAALVPDVRDEPWHRFLAEIQDLRDSNDYGWAAEALEAIAATVTRTQRVTDAQRWAIDTIRNTAWAPGRVYDQWGHGRRWR